MVIVSGTKLLIKPGWTLKLFKTLIGDRCSSRSSLNDTCSLGFSSTYQQEKAESSENCCRVLYSAEHLFNRNHGWILIDICERL